MGYLTMFHPYTHILYNKEDTYIYTCILPSFIPTHVSCITRRIHTYIHVSYQVSSLHMYPVLQGGYIHIYMYLTMFHPCICILYYKEDTYIYTCILPCSIPEHVSCITRRIHTYIHVSYHVPSLNMYHVLQGGYIHIYMYLTMFHP